ncbi:unnamed protein product [Parascedosporium putredinis]|uniref:Aminoglycoside phosphotransferase domain-containing protein n=1 Tax=Parascedosporium putredinis TaxID=1442378 RepID=A0A9P1MGR1_9PEZI|nr:unnamed protein product [Parascedosporium putredinis]CAI8004940.1 unnamed protein product [Parascedosporium putredinis]
MPGKPRHLCAEKDDLLWQKLEEESDEWYESVRTAEKRRQVGNFIWQYKDAKPTLMHPVLRAQLALQYNDVAEDDGDVCDKFVARSLFRRLIDSHTFESDQECPTGDFRLFSEDLRPANVLVDENLKVVGVIDWEFAYMAPAEFTFDPPWWLLLLEAKDWPGGYGEWIKAYEPRFHTFLRVLEVEEKKIGTNGVLSSSDPDGGMSTLPLSQRMRMSWKEKTWLINYAVLDSWGFDFIWWKFLDERFYGPNEDQDHRSRLHLLSEPQTTAMCDLVATKAHERLDRKIFEWDEGLAFTRLRSLQ